MFRQKQLLPAALSALLAASVPLATQASQSSDALLPATTKGYISISQLENFEKQFDATQLGQLLRDKTMEPFRESLESQLWDENDFLAEKLGLEIEDLDSITQGELALAIIEQTDRPAALAIVIDVEGREAEARKLLANVEKNFAQRNAEKEVVAVGDDELIVFALPSTGGSTGQQTVYLIKENMLIGVDSRTEAQAMLKRFAAGAGGSQSLRTVDAYAAVMKRCQQAAGDLTPDVRWYVDPFGFVQAWRSIDSQTLAFNRDLAQILSETGFDAVQSVGGLVNLLVTPHYEWVYRTYAYAPPVAGRENDPLRWNSSMRMMQMHNSEDMSPEPWVPRMIANYASINLDMPNAFDHLKPLFDAMAGYEDAFDTTMEGFEFDPYGPQVNMRKEFVAHMDNRITVITDYTMPVTPESERYIYAVKAKDAEKLAATLNKIMENDPDAVKLQVGEVMVWEILEPELDYAELDLDPSLSVLAENYLDSDVAEEQRMFPNSAACVAEGYLLLASDVDLLRLTLAATALSERLINSPDYRQAEEAVRQLTGEKLSGWMFARLDETYRPTYELLRQGRMPESKTMLGYLLNEMFTTEQEADEDVLREQQLDGRLLPEFEMVRRYFGPSCQGVRSDVDGWLITSAEINKEAE